MPRIDKGQFSDMIREMNRENTDLKRYFDRAERMVGRYLARRNKSAHKTKKGRSKNNLPRK